VVILIILYGYPYIFMQKNINGKLCDSKCLYSYFILMFIIQLKLIFLLRRKRLILLKKNNDQQSTVLLDIVEVFYL
jgi:hypothetical protein